MKIFYFNKSLNRSYTYVIEIKYKPKIVIIEKNILLIITRKKYNISISW